MFEIFEILLEKKGITMYRLCKDLNFDPALLSNWKKGKTRPTLEKLISIADYFGVSLDYLFGRMPEPYIVKIREDPDKQALLEAYDNLTEKKKAKLLAYLDGLLDSDEESKKR